MLPLIGTAGFVRSWSQFLTSPDAKAAPLTVLQNFMADYGAMFELDAAEILRGPDGLQLSRMITTASRT